METEADRKAAAAKAKMDDDARAAAKVKTDADGRRAEAMKPWPAMPPSQPFPAPLEQPMASASEVKAAFGQAPESAMTVAAAKKARDMETTVKAEVSSPPIPEPGQGKAPQPVEGKHPKAGMVRVHLKDSSTSPVRIRVNGTEVAVLRVGEDNDIPENAVGALRESGAVFTIVE